ncbi:MAG: nucleoside-diphosphate sugar epimerase/dehydratase [Candidatus Omnitrophota bacterium]
MLTRFRKPVSMLVDVILINASLLLAFMIRFDWHLTPIMIKACSFFMIAASIVKISIFNFFGIYQWEFRLASISEAVNILRAATIASLLLIAAAFFTQSYQIGRSVLLIDYLIFAFVVAISRFSPKVLLQFKQSRCKGLKKVLIIGAGSAGEMVTREMFKAENRVYDPIGFIDDNPLKMHSRIHGIKVLGTTNEIKEIVEKHNVQELIIALPSADGFKIRDIVSKCEKTECKIKIVPALHKILTGEISIKQIRDVQAVDLMGRAAVEIDNDEVSSFLRDRVILVTGAGGSIGSELCRQISEFSPRLLLLCDHNENDVYFLELELKDKFPNVKLKIVIGDVKDIGLLKYMFSSYLPQVVFHSAAHKHVPLMEENPTAAVKNNIIATRNLMYAAEHYGVGNFVMISSDKAVNPTNVMGASKRIAEMMIQAKAKTSTVKTKFMAVRFGNVIGSSGSVVPIFKKQIEKGGPVTVTHSEVKRYFMAASEAAQLVIQAGAIGKGGEVFILDMGDQIKIEDLARNLITLSGFEPDEDIKIKYIGLRPGEKMYEEMLLDTEHDKATKYDKIYVAQPEEFNPRELRRDIKTLEHLAQVMNTKKILEKMKEMVPSYHGS